MTSYICRKALSLAAATSLLWAPSFAAAGEVLDQQYDFDSAIGDTASLFSQEIGQTFTVGVAGTLTRVEVKMSRFGFTSDDAVLTLYSTSGGLPNATLGSAIVNSALVSTTAPTFVPFDLTSSSTPVSVDEVLAFGISSSSGGTYVLPYPMPSGEYAGGSSVRRTLAMPPEPWSFQTGRDYGFKTYVAASAAFLPADFDEDHDVDAHDLARWEMGFGMVASATHMQGDADADGDADGVDFLTWQRQFTGIPAAVAAAAVPEPSTVVPLLMGYGVAVLKRRRIFR